MNAYAALGFHTQETDGDNTSIQRHDRQTVSRNQIPFYPSLYFMLRAPRGVGGKKP